VYHPVAPEAIKLAFAVGYWLWTHRRRGQGGALFGDRSCNHENGHREHADAEEEGLPLNGVGEYLFDDDGHQVSRKPAHQHGVATTRVPPSVACALTVLAAVLFSLNRRNVRLCVPLLFVRFIDHWRNGRIGVLGGSAYRPNIYLACCIARDLRQRFLSVFLAVEKHSSFQMASRNTSGMRCFVVHEATGAS
jgi:hypothetical protein